MHHILLIDDDPDILEILNLELQDDPSCRVRTSTSAEEALALAKNNPYDVIIADWRMPVMNGTELVRALRLLGSRAYIIIYSGKGMCHDIREALASGADYYVNRGGDPDSEFAELKKQIRDNAGR
jgi:CheY-like chemotaxis protein